MRAKTGTDGGGCGLHQPGKHPGAGREEYRSRGEPGGQCRQSQNEPTAVCGDAICYEAEQDRYICPAGKLLLYEGRDERGGISYLKYKAAAEDCKNCSLRAACCGGNQKHSRSIVRSKESPVMNAFREKMATGQAQAVYRRRGPIAEFVHAWIKSKLGLRQFHVRGLSKVRAEMLWVCFTFNVQQWIRLGRAPAMARAN